MVVMAIVLLVIFVYFSFVYLPDYASHGDEEQSTMTITTSPTTSMVSPRPSNHTTPIIALLFLPSFAIAFCFFPVVLFSSPCCNSQGSKADPMKEHLLDDTAYASP
jgi:hypothetical protein